MNSEFSKGQLLQMDIWTRISSTFAGHYDLAAYLSVALVIIGVVIILQKNIPLKIISLIIWIASFQVFTFTASRISTFAFWGGMCLALFLLRKYLWIIPVTALVIFSVASSKDLNQRFLATIPALKHQLAFLQNSNNTPSKITPTIAPSPTVVPSISIPSGKPSAPTPTIVRHTLPEEQVPIDSDVGVARSGEIRFNVEWPRAITAFEKNVLLGTGLGSLTLATDNDYLRLLGESGLLGLVSFMAIQIYFIVKTIPIIFKKNHDFIDKVLIILLACQLTTLANAIFIDVFEASKTAYLFWLMMGIYYQTLQLKIKET
jgi:O-antigen ligase